MVEVQICELAARFSAMLSNGLRLEIKACTLPKAVNYIKLSQKSRMK
jgi:hypothetical protein